MANDDYLVPRDAALALVATAMKKARLGLDVLILNSIMGGTVFTAGGMLHCMVVSRFNWSNAHDPGVLDILSGLSYPIGLFFVVVLGLDLFNSNILYLSVGFYRGAVSIFDVMISWGVSFIFNLGATLFVVYVMCDRANVVNSTQFVDGTIQLAMHKDSFSFAETLLKGIAGNFFVALAIYLQVMVRPLHVKLLMLALPVFTFVTMGFSHSVADMFVVPMGMVRGAPISVGRYIWHILIPASIGNIIGGSFFGLVIPWYLHIVVVERDNRKLGLPEYEEKDEQPEQNMDSRVVRTPIKEENRISSSSSNVSPYAPSIRSNAGSMRSPRGVFPVSGMGPPLKREQSIASGNFDRSDNSDQSEANPYDPDTEHIGERLRRRVTRSRTELPDRPGFWRRGTSYLPRASLTYSRRSDSVAGAPDLPYPPTAASRQTVKRAETN